MHALEAVVMPYKNQLITGMILPLVLSGPRGNCLTAPCLSSLAFAIGNKDTERPPQNRRID